MDNSTALAFLANLVEHIERDAITGKLKLDGVISEREYEALGFALELLGGSFDPEPRLDPRRAPPAVLEPEPAEKDIPLNLDSIALEGPEDAEVLLCLDFGTAMSKAFATESTDDQLLDLPIGKQAGQTEPLYSLVSSIFITNSGRILFGHRAIGESTHTDSGTRRRFDSIKDILCKDVVCDLDEAPLEAPYNPTEVRLTKGDMVTLFLAYFTDMAASELEDQGYSRYVRRRFTRPVLPQDRAPWAEDQLRTLLARAQVLADTLHGQWNDGIDAAKVKHILRQIKNLEEVPTFLVDEGVVEPVAAVGSRFREFVCEKAFRRLLMVVDVGAGTIDYALFAELHKKGHPIQVWQLPGSVQVLRQAGDAVDKLLRRYILKKSDVSTTDNDFHMIDADLSLRIRQLKEQLFREKRTEFYLTNDRSGVITLNEFLIQPGVKELEKAIHEKFAECLKGVHESWISGLGGHGLAIVFTGGGASLPMVRSLGRGDTFAYGKRIQLMPSTLTPRWVEEDDPDLAEEFPQLAVAIGGSSRSLPVLAPKTFQEFGGLEAEGWTIPPASKGV
jgi:molecular chaperone HscA